jgi:hypothetical protein
MCLPCSDGLSCNVRLCQRSRSGHSNSARFQARVCSRLPKPAHFPRSDRRTAGRSLTDEQSARAHQPTSLLLCALDRVISDPVINCASGWPLFFANYRTVTKFEPPWVTRAGRLLLISCATGIVPVPKTPMLAQHRTGLPIFRHHSWFAGA